MIKKYNSSAYGILGYDENVLLKAQCFDILLKNKLIWFEDKKINFGKVDYCVLIFDENDFENKQEFETIKEVLQNVMQS